MLPLLLLLALAASARGAEQGGIGPQLPGTAAIGSLLATAGLQRGAEEAGHQQLQVGC